MRAFAASPLQKTTERLIKILTASSEASSCLAEPYTCNRTGAASDIYLPVPPSNHSKRVETRSADAVRLRAERTRAGARPPSPAAHHCSRQTAATQAARAASASVSAAGALRRSEAMYRRCPSMPAGSTHACVSLIETHVDPGVYPESGHCLICAAVGMATQCKQRS